MCQINISQLDMFVLKGHIMNRILSTPGIPNIKDDLNKTQGFRVEFQVFHMRQDSESNIFDLIYHVGQPDTSNWVLLYGRLYLSLTSLFPRYKFSPCCS